MNAWHVAADGHYVPVSDLQQLVEDSRVLRADLRDLRAEIGDLHAAIGVTVAESRRVLRRLNSSLRLAYSSRGPQ